ncbi:MULTISPECIES: DUF3486 family protein [unclassified Aeromonas]|uniref:DUF3486 family protein n=1 Tax=unclassified Aeromonas TaxID=257493 RepID=UPI0022E3AE0E|nr:MULTISPECIES: DUF3486 family protein [unclassified Aeromonas]
MATKKNTKSKIQQLPDDIRSQLAAMLRSGSMSQKDILAEVNKLIVESGLPPEEQISRTGLNRFSKRMAEAGSRMEQAREVAAVWTSKLGQAPTSEVGKLLQEFVRTMAFETSMKMMDASDGEEGKMIDPKSLGQLALVIQRVEQAAMTSHKVEKEIRAAFAAEAATAAEKIVKSAGLTAETAAQIKQQILGIA